jgi:hypothetical protein
MQYELHGQITELVTNTCFIQTSQGRNPQNLKFPRYSLQEPLSILGRRQHFPIIVYFPSGYRESGYNAILMTR